MDSSRDRGILKSFLFPLFIFSFSLLSISHDKTKQNKKHLQKKKINKQSHNIQTYILIKTYLSIVSTNNPLDFFFPVLQPIEDEL